MLLVSLVLHELAHAWTAHHLGDETPTLTGRLTPNPLAHLEPGGSFVVPVLVWAFAGVAFGWARPVPINPSRLGWRRVVVVAMAGPAVNVALAIVATAALLLLEAGPGWDLALFAALSNLAMAVGNLLPVDPLDGARVLRALRRRAP